MTGRGLSRRAVLRGMFGAAIALPLLEAMEWGAGRGRRARAAAPTPPRRFVVMYTPNGTIPKHFWPSGGERDFVLSRILAPLERHRNDLLILGGIDMLSSMSGPGDAHQKGTGHALTATELLPGNFAGDAGQNAGWAGGISIDQKIADHIGGDTLFPSLEFGVLVDGSDVRSRISYRGPGQPLPPESSPYVMYRRIFGDSSADPAKLQRLAAQKTAVLDMVAEEYKKLGQKLGAADREKVEVHLRAVNDVRARLFKGQAKFGGACQPMDQGAPLDPTRVANMPQIGKLQMDLLALAFACDVTRVATLMWTRSTAMTVYSFLGKDIYEGHHSLAHKGDEDTAKVEQNTRINTWFAEQLAYLIDRLKAIPEGTGTVFDNTVILWTNEQARGNNHDRHEMPYVLAGSAGGYFQTGRFVRQTSETGHNKLLVSLQQAFGIESDEFGNPAYGTGPLPGLR